jgi:hypothetical protein
MLRSVNWQILGHPEDETERLTPKSLHNTPEERSFHLHRGGGLKSRKRKGDFILRCGSETGGSRTTCSLSDPFGDPRNFSKQAANTVQR